jgi:hypothetical protein
MAEAVLLMTHLLDDCVEARCRRLMAEAGRPVTILYNRADDPDRARALPPDLPVFAFDGPEMRRLGFPRKGRFPSACDVDCFVLLYAEARPLPERLWVVEYDVDFSGRWSALFDAFLDSGADLLATTVLRHAATPGWENWKTVRSPAGRPDPDRLLRAFLPCHRVSRRALGALKAAYRAGWSGHYEATVPTVLAEAGLAIEDMGGDGEFVRPGNRNRFYTNTPAAADLSPGSFVFRPVRRTCGPEPGWLWHPVKPPRSASGWATGRRARFLRWAKGVLSAMS